MTVQIIKDENYVTMYIDGKSVISGHSLYPEEVAEAILGENNVKMVDLDDLAYNDDHNFTYDDNGNVFLDGMMVWINGKGHPDIFPDNL